jgi:hypothetical protein
VLLIGATCKEELMLLIRQNSPYIKPIEVDHLFVPLCSMLRRGSKPSHQRTLEPSSRGKSGWVAGCVEIFSVVILNSNLAKLCVTSTMEEK